MKTSRVACFLAVRSVVRGNYGITALTAIMLLLIYVSLLFLPSLIQGAVNRVNGLLVDTVTSDIVITSTTKSGISGPTRYLSAIRKTPGVADATAVYRAGTQVAYGNNSGTWTIDAIDPASYASVFTTPSNILEGRYLTQNDTDAAFLGIDIAGAGQTNLRGYKASLQDVHAGDTVSVTLDNGRSSTLHVVGIYDNQFPLSDDDAFITLEEAETLLPGIEDAATSVYVRTAPGADVTAVAKRLEPLHADVKILTSDQLGTVVEDQVATFDLISDILKLISLLMAAVTVFIVTYVDLVNKRRQIGIERAIGIRSIPIVMSYALKALAYAVVGVGLGLLLFEFGLVPLVKSHPFHFPNGPVTLAPTTGEILVDLAILGVVALLAAVIPAMRTTRLRILDAIWGA